MSGPVATYTADDVRALVTEYPLAWVTALGGRGVQLGTTPASLLPLLGEYDDDGRLVSLLGHMSRRNALHALSPTGMATPMPEPMPVTILFTGPHGYVSPAQAEARDWAPSWNYAQLVVEAQLTFLADETAPAVDALVMAMEDGRWTGDELGPRRAGMLDAIIGFRAQVRTLDARFKLGQDEQRPVFAAICRNHPDAALVRWMRRFDR